MVACSHPRSEDGDGHERDLLSACAARSDLCPSGGADLRSARRRDRRHGQRSRHRRPDRHDRLRQCPGGRSTPARRGCRSSRHSQSSTRASPPPIIARSGPPDDVHPPPRASPTRRNGMTAHTDPSIDQPGSAASTRPAPPRPGRRVHARLLTAVRRPPPAAPAALRASLCRGGPSVPGRAPRCGWPARSAAGRRTPRGCGDRRRRAASGRRCRRSPGGRRRSRRG